MADIKTTLKSEETGDNVYPNIVEDNIPNGSVTNDKIVDATIAYEKLSQALKNLIDGKASQTDLETVQNALTNHTSNTSNPHSVTKSQVGLGNVDNTSDADKPISDAAQAALDLKADKATTYTKTEVDIELALKADKSNTYTKTEVDSSLALKADKSTTYTKTEVDTELALKADKSTTPTLSGNNTFTGKQVFSYGTGDISVYDWDSIYFRDYEKSLGDLFDEKQDFLISGTNIKTINNESLLGSGNINISGGSQLYKYHIVLSLYNTPNDYNEYSFNADVISPINIDTASILNQFINTWAKYQTIYALLNNEISGTGLSHSGTITGTFYFYELQTESEFNDTSNDFCEFGYYDSVNTNLQYDAYNRQHHELKIDFISKEAL